MKEILAAVDFSDYSDAVVSRAASLALAFGANVTLLHVAAPDPDFVGYGIGGYGHMVTSMDALTDRDGARVPGFVEIVDELSWRVDWTPLFQDLGLVHTSFADGWARELARMAWPSTEG